MQQSLQLCSNPCWLAHNFVLPRWYPKLVLRLAAAVVAGACAVAVYMVALAWGAPPVDGVGSGWGQQHSNMAANGSSRLGWDVAQNGTSRRMEEGVPPTPLSHVPAAVIAGAAGLCAALSLSLVGGLVDDAVNALWVCYADDSELCTCAQPEVHAVVAQLPSVGRLLADAGNHFAPHGTPVTPQAPLGLLTGDPYTYVTLPPGATASADRPL